MWRSYQEAHSHGGPAMARHLTLVDREVLQRLLKRKYSKPKIAALMNRHESTIYRELARNSSARGYRAQHAQHVADGRRQASCRPSKLADVEVRQYVTDRLAQAWSPDQIAGRARREFPQTPQRQVSAVTIYAWIQIGRASCRER